MLTFLAQRFLRRCFDDHSLFCMFVIISLAFEEDVALYLNNLEFPSPKEVF
jgi:hypothetical protein